MERQATMLAYIDNFRILSIVTLLLIPALADRKKPRAARSVPVH